MKRCSRRGEFKPLDAFYRRKLSSDGRQAECRECAQERDRLRYADPSTGRAERLKQQVVDPVVSTVRHARWYRKNRDQVLAINQQWRTSNRERVNAQARERWANDRERQLARVRAWQKANPERHAARESLRRARLKGAADERFSVEFMTALCASLRAQACVYCGSVDRIEIDHVVPITRGGRHTPDNLVPACKRCNCSKGDRLLDEWYGPTRADVLT